MRRLSHHVDESCDGKTVLHVLRKKLLVSDGAVRRAKPVEDGITLDGVRCRVNERVHAGQTVSIAVDDACVAPGASAVAAERGPVDVVYLDDDLAVVNKRPGVVVHPGPRHPSGTLSNFLLGYLEDRGIRCNPHPVQRLDRGTSGLLVFALNAHVQHRLQQQLHTSALVREYLAVCEGSFGAASAVEGVVDAPIACMGGVPRTFAVRDDGKRAVTRYRVLGAWKVDGACGAGACSLVRLRLETGRTHQVRLHMSHIGHPLLGDATYGNASPLIDRPALHSWHLSFVHPATGERLDFAAPLPPDFASLLPDALRDTCAYDAECFT